MANTQDVVVDITSDGKTVWVNSSTGECIGRFGRMGVDIHRPSDEQSTKGQCLDCTHGPAGLVEWGRFVIGMKAFFNVTVGLEHKPTWLD